MLEATPSTFAFGFLGVAVAALWLSKRPWLWGSLLLISVILAVVSGVMNGAAIAVGLLAAAVIYAFYRVPCSTRWKFILGILMSVLTLGLFGHFFPGFQQQTLFSDVVLSPGAYPTSLYWNFDKPLAGLLLMGWGMAPVHDQGGWKKILPTAIGLYLACAGVMIAGALALRVFRWAPHWTQASTLFALTNLFFVSVPEEAFFRGFVQRELSGTLERYRRGKIWSVGIASIIFGLCHFQGGPGLMFAATIAGLFYGEAFRRTGRLEAAIFVHFLLNLSHFALFSYPALQR